jgi:hypothetical protein
LLRCRGCGATYTIAEHPELLTEELEEQLSNFLVDRI